MLVTAPVAGSQMAATADPAANRSAVHFDAIGQPVVRSSGGVLTSVMAITTGRVASDVTNTTTTLAAITGLGMPVVAGGVYVYEWTGTYTSSSTSCFIAAGVNGPSVGSSGVICNLHLHVGVGADTWHSGCTSAFNTSNNPGFIAAANTAIPWRLYGSVEIGVTGGTLSPVFARASGAGTITIKTNSRGWAWRIG